MSTLVKLAIAAGVVAAVLGGLAWFGNSRYDEGYRVAERKWETATENLKTEARIKLAAETDAVRALTAKLKVAVAEKEVEREKAQSKNADDLRRRAAGPRLQFSTQATGRGDCGRPAEVGASSPAKDPAPTVVQLPEPLNGNLLQYGADAESLAIDYGVLYRYVNDPKLVCELRK